MLYATAARLRPGSPDRTEVVPTNALIESFATHARGLALFLYPDAQRRDHGNAVTADDYVADPKKWRRARPKRPHELSTVIDRTAKEIAHLTIDRHPPGSPKKRWGPDPILKAFSEPFRVFLDHISPERLDAHVATLLAHLSSPPPNPEPRGVGVAVLGAFTNLTTEPTSVLTDVATTAPRFGGPIR